jgi:biotin transport system ATP-binding protein
VQKIHNNSEPVIYIKDLCYSFPDGRIGLDKVSLSVFKGEFILLAGQNGSGKTTLLRHMNGLLLSGSGVVQVKGLDVSKHLLMARKTIGMVFQDPDTQLIGDTVFDEVAFGPENLGLSRALILEKVSRSLEMLNITHLKDRIPATLSGGEKRKIAIAGVIVMDPEVILFDEPFSNLDYPGILQVLSAIVKLNRHGHAIIIAGHDIEPVLYHADRIIIMDKGKIREDGQPSATVRLLESYGVRSPCCLKFGMEASSWLIQELGVRS